MYSKSLTIGKWQCRISCQQSFPICNTFWSLAMTKYDRRFLCGRQSKLKHGGLIGMRKHIQTQMSIQHSRSKNSFSTSRLLTTLYNALRNMMPRGGCILPVQVSSPLRSCMKNWYTPTRKQQLLFSDTCAYQCQSILLSRREQCKGSPMRSPRNGCNTIGRSSKNAENGKYHTGII